MQQNAADLQVNFPDDWKVDAEQAKKIKKTLDGIAAEKKAARDGATGKWYWKLTKEQINECKQNPQLFVVRFPPCHCPVCM